MLRKTSKIQIVVGDILNGAVTRKKRITSDKEGLFALHNLSLNGNSLHYLWTIKEDTLRMAH